MIFTSFYFSATCCYKVCQTLKLRQSEGFSPFKGTQISRTSIQYFNIKPVTRESCNDAESGIKQQPMVIQSLDPPLNCAELVFLI